MSSRVILLGVPIDSVTQVQALEKLQNFLEENGQRHVTTPNNEMLVEAAKNPSFLQLLQKSDLNLPDSKGLLLMARWTGQKLLERVTGVDTVEALCALLDERHPVFLLGAAPGMAQRAASVLQSKNPRLKIVGYFSGSPHANDAADIIARINDSKPHLLLVAFGAPAQDLWIAEHLRQMPSVTVAMGVGGTFDFIAGSKMRAPKLLRNLGLEWLWRFVQEPSRWKRIWRAVIVFPILVFRYGKQPPSGCAAAQP